MKAMFLNLVIGVGLWLGASLQAEATLPAPDLAESGLLRTAGGYSIGLQTQSYRYQEPTVGVKNKGYLHYGCI